VSDEPTQIPGRVRAGSGTFRQFGFDEDSEDRTGVLFRSLAAANRTVTCWS
jgi:hypothetical protein